MAWRRLWLPYLPRGSSDNAGTEDIDLKFPVTSRPELGVSSSILILTGAGVSAESGIDTFRAKGGIWSKIDYREVATPDGFARNPGKVLDFYNKRRRKLVGLRPNAAHLALAQLEQQFHGTFLLVTQNIDGLHEAAGSHRLIHMHGGLNKALCEACGRSSSWSGDMTINSRCPVCETVGRLRPDVVWFGEMPYQMPRIHEALMHCDLFISIGTSGNVYPAAGFVEEARYNGIHTVELNLEPSEGSTMFSETHYGRATEIVPRFVEELLRG